MTQQSSPGFGKRVRSLREIGGLTQRSLDTHAGLHQGHTWQIEEGHAENPKLETVRKIARVFGCPVGWLANAEGDRPSDEAIKQSVAEFVATNEAAS